MSQATRTIEVNVELEKFFDVIANYRAYPEFLAHLGVVGVSVLSEEGSACVVEHQVRKLGKTISYTLRYVEERPKQVSWSLVKGQLMSLNQGSWVLKEAGPQRTRATYSVEVRFGLLVPKSLVTKLVSSELPEMLNAFKRRAETNTT